MNQDESLISGNMPLESAMDSWRLSRRRFVLALLGLAGVVSAGLTSTSTGSRALAASMPPAGGSERGHSALVADPRADAQRQAREARAGQQFVNEWNDPHLRERDFTFSSGDAVIRAYEARFDIGKLAETARQVTGADTPMVGMSDAEVPIPLVIIIHDTGLTDHARRIARRIALNARVACAIDLFSRDGGSDQSVSTERRALLDARASTFFLPDIQAAIEFYRSQPYADANELGMLGFGFGGGVTWQAVVSMPGLRAAVCFYGESPEPSSLANARAAVLGVYSSDPTDAANQGRGELADALAANGIQHHIVVHPSTRSGFFDETGPTYNSLATARAWSDVDGWYRRHLSMGSRDMLTPKERR